MLQALREALWPVGPQRLRRRQQLDLWLRPLLALLIGLLCGPEVFLAADFIVLLDLFGALLFLTVFALAYRALALFALDRLRQIMLPLEWAALFGSPRNPSLVAFGTLMIGIHTLRLTVFALVAAVGLHGAGLVIFAG